MEEQVIPWLYDRIMDFIREDEATIKGSSEVVTDGIAGTCSAHVEAIKAKKARDEKAKADKLEAERQT